MKVHHFTELFESENITIKNFSQIMAEKFFSNFTMEDHRLVPRWCRGPAGDKSTSLIFVFKILTEPSSKQMLKLLNYLKDFLVVEKFTIKAENYYGNICMIIDYQLNTESLSDYLDAIKYNL